MNENETVVNEIPEKQGCADCAEYEQAIVAFFVIALVFTIIASIASMIVGLFLGKKLTVQ
jgi:hypothetical protein